MNPVATEVSSQLTPLGRARALASGVPLLLLGIVLAGGLRSRAADGATNHWAFQILRRPDVPSVAEAGRIRTPVDGFIQKRLERAGLSLGEEADRGALIRRVAFTLTGLPPTPEEIEAFVHDLEAGAYERRVERYLDSPHYGECVGKHWLDTAGYADSNGYFSADTDRPLAYRYRDYVIRSFNRDKPFDAFVREQLAGDELSGWHPGQPATPEIIELLEATHYLRNAQDGSGESDGNPDELRVDRYYALESTMQIMGSSLLGLTLQCAKCHDHKFEPFTQKDYYSLQCFLYPAFNIEQWVKPNDRVTQANLPGELETWQTRERDLDNQRDAWQREFNRWVADHRPRGQRLFDDTFEDPTRLAEKWSNTAPGDDVPGGSPEVKLGGDGNEEEGPAATVQEGHLRVLEGGGSGDRWISTRADFDWRPGPTGAWIQVTFDLVALRVRKKENKAERVGYLIALHDFNDNSEVPGGNVLIDGNPDGPTSVHVDYPGRDAKGRGQVGGTGYRAGRNYGVRITRETADALRLEHLVDGAVDGDPLMLSDEDLPRGGFGFEYCCGRSFIVDNVAVEASPTDDPDWTRRQMEYTKELADRKKRMDEKLASLKAQRTPKPGSIAWVSDLSPEPPTVHLLSRGNPKTPGDEVEPAFPKFLGSGQEGEPTCGTKIEPTPTTTGRRLAWARWITDPGSRQAALLARVTVNRAWQNVFGVGLVSTPDNLGLSGARPSHPELLEWLAGEFVDSGWSMKSLYRLILASAVFRQSSAPRASALALDPANQWLWRYPLRRLDAEEIRDAMLAAGGRCSAKSDGPYVPTTRSGSGEVVVDESRSDGLARSVFLQQRRTQVATFLGVFDAPSLVFNCTRRAETTMPLQSLSLLNSEFAVKRGRDLAERLRRECGTDETAKLRRAFLLTCGRVPDSDEESASLRFLDGQRALYLEQAESDAEERAWADFCQTLFGLNSFLYLE